MQANIARAALEFVCNAVSEAETIGNVERFGSRAEALAAVAPDIVSRCKAALDSYGTGVASKHPFLTGSHAYGTPTADSDIDMVVWAEDAQLRELLVGGGYPIRYGKLNIILCDNETDWGIWKKGTEALKRVAPVDRETAVAFLQSLGLSQTNMQEEPYSDPVVGDEAPVTDGAPTLEEWIDGWQVAIQDGLSNISREEAERRYYKEYGRVDLHQNGEG